MDTKDFIVKLHKDITGRKILALKEIFNNTKEENVSDLYWKKALILYKKLNETDQEIFFEILEQVSVDTLSRIFAILDGVSFLEGQDDDLEIYFSKNKNEKINGDMQDMFLEYDEEVRKSEETREC